MKKAQRLAKRGSWGQIEQWLIECEQGKLRTESGELQMMFVHYGVAANANLSRSMPDAKWHVWLKKIEKWEPNAQRKDIVAAVKLDYWNSYAWKARSNGRAYKVKGEQWQGFRERLGVSLDIYEQALKGGVKHPWFYTEALSVALGMGWSNERTLEDVLKPGLALEPENLQLLRDYAYRLEERWYGEKHDDYRFFKTIPSLIPGELGEEMYTRIILRKKLQEITGYQYDLVDWPLMQRGMRKIVSKYPKSTQMMRFFMSFAERHGEFDKGVALIKSASPEAYTYFSEKGEFGRVLKLHDTLGSELQRVNYFKPKPNLGVDDVSSIAWLPDGEKYVASSRWRGLHLMHKNGVESLDRFDPSGKCLVEVAISNDGEYIAVASNYDAQYGYKDTKIYILRVEGDSLELEKEVVLDPINTMALSFSGDDSKLLVSYYTKNNAPRGLYAVDWRSDSPKCEKLYQVGARAGWIRRVISPKGENYVIVVNDGIKKLPLTAGGAAEQLVTKKEAPQGELCDIALLGGARYLAVLSWHHELKQLLYVYDLELGKRVIEKRVDELLGRSWKLAELPLQSGSSDLLMVGVHGGLVRWGVDLNENNIQLISVDHGNGQKLGGLAVSPRRDDGVQVTVGSWKGMMGNWLLPAASE